MASGEIVESNETRNSGIARTGTAEDTGHLDELDGLLSGIHLGEEARALSSGGGSAGVVGGWTG